MFRRSSWQAAVFLVFVAAPVLAHHSAAGIDRSKTHVVTGTVKEFRWTNPHSWIDLEVADAKGATRLGSLEMTSPPFLLRAGWKATTLRSGDKVIVAVRPMRDGTPGGLFVSVTFADGRTLTQRAPPPPTQ